MSRKNVNGPFALFKAVDISTNQTSTASSVEYLDNVGIIATWTGTTPVGVITVEVSNDVPTGQPSFIPTNWSALAFGVAIAVSGNTGSANINMNQLPYAWVRMKYTATSGTGTMTANLVSKMV